MGYLRTKTRPQGDRSILHKQKNFGGGLNVDVPASDINNNELSNAENVICYERYLRGRPGSVHALDLSGSGDTSSIMYHRPGKKVVYQRGNGLYYGTSEILDFDDAQFPDFADSLIKPYNEGKDAIIFGEDGIYYITLSFGTPRFFKVNSSQPTVIATAQGTSGDQYKYKYMFTFSTILLTNGVKSTTGDRNTSGQTLIHETPPALPGDVTDNSYWRLLTKAVAIDNSNPMTIPQAGLDTGAQSEVTHISWYRTRDTGPNGLNNQFDENFVWIGDQPIDDTNFVDGISDDIIRGRLSAGGFQPRNIGWSAIPSSTLGEITANFMFVAVEDTHKLYYNQITFPELLGYYNPGFQYHVFDSGIRVIASTPDILVVCCNKETNTISLNSYRNEGVLESLLVLDHIPKVDPEIGVTDPGSFTPYEEGSFISICSDNSVRVFDGASWGRDLAKDKVGDIIDGIHKDVTQAIYYKGAYFIFFNRDGNVTDPDECLRYSLKKESGNGWSFYTGSELVMPPSSPAGWAGIRKLLFIGDSLEGSALIGEDLLYCVDKDDSEGKVYWLETFDGPDNITVNGYAVKRYYGDKISSVDTNGTEIIPKWRGKDITGSQEAFKIIHQESHTYVRPVPTTILTRPTLYMDALAYVNGSLVSEETAGRIPYDGDIHFWYRVEGQRIAVEFQANRSGFDVIGTDTRCRVQDIARWGSRSSVTVGSDFQRNFQQNLTFWAASRPAKLVTLDRKNKTRWSRNGIVTQDSPDGRSQALQIGNNDSIDSFVSDTKTTYDDEFTFIFWCKGPSLPSSAVPIIQIDGSGANQGLTISFTSTTNMRIKSNTTVDVIVNDISGVNNTVNGYHLFALVRQSGSTDLNIYQNDLLIDTVTFGDTFGGGETELGGLV